MHKKRSCIKGWTDFYEHTDGLEVERHQLTAGIPEELRVVVGRIHSSAFRVDPAQLQFVVSEQNCLRTMLNRLDYRTSLSSHREDTLQTPLGI